MPCKQDMNFKSICLCESGKVADCKLNFFLFVDIIHAIHTIHEET